MYQTGRQNGINLTRSNKFVCPFSHTNFPANNTFLHRTEGAVRLFGYGIMSVLCNICGPTPLEMDVIMHEWLHMFGPIDLYDMGKLVWQIPGGIGSFDIMANGNRPMPTGHGTNGTPGSLSPYSKMLAGYVFHE